MMFSQKENYENLIVLLEKLGLRFEKMVQLPGEAKEIKYFS